MTLHYPRIRIHAQNSYLLIRDGLIITFYMQHSHAESAPAALRALEVYLSEVGMNALDIYVDEEGDWQQIQTSSCGYVRQEMRRGLYMRYHLTDSSITENRYDFEYHGKSRESSDLPSSPDARSAVSFWLPTEYLERQGPARVRELALELAAPLPFCSGQMGLSFNCRTELLGVTRELRTLCFRYPGMDIPMVRSASWDIGSRLRGPSWMTFLGPPVLGALGGVEALRARLHSPGTTVQALGPERAVITLGPWPEAGDLEAGQTLPAYRELARVLEPWLYHHYPLRSFDAADWRRWERRFLDG